MKTTYKTILAVTSLLAAISLPAYALDISVDGNVSDWGITVKDTAKDKSGKIVSTSNWKPTDGITYVAEDFDDTLSGNSYRVFPGLGGQKYDAEGLYVKIDGDKLYILVVTGLKPEGWGDALPGPMPRTILPGDIAISFENDITKAEFGIETTGTNAGGLYRVPEVFKLTQKFYFDAPPAPVNKTLATNSFKAAVVEKEFATADALWNEIVNAVAVYNSKQTKTANKITDAMLNSWKDVTLNAAKDTKWGHSPYNWYVDANGVAQHPTAFDTEGDGKGSISDPTEMHGGELLGMGELVYTQIAGTTKHYAIEMAVDVSMFGNFWKQGGTFDVHWTMTCANDAIDIQNVKVVTPEPGTLALLGLGLIGVFGMARKRLI